MSDMRSWIKMVEDFMPQQTVQIKPEHGGGVGRVVGQHGDTLDLDAKGTAVEIPMTGVLSADGVDPLSQKYDDFQKSNTSVQSTEHPDMQSGDMVIVKNVYGTGTGDGYGVFAAYSTDGTRALVNFDGTIKDLPVGMVSPATEQAQKDNFAASGSNGKDSPIPGSCNCMSYDCTTCYPAQSIAPLNFAQEPCNEPDDMECSNDEQVVVMSLTDDDDFEDDDLVEVAPIIGAAARIAAPAIIGAMVGGSDDEEVDEEFDSELTEACIELRESDTEFGRELDDLYNDKEKDGVVDGDKNSTEDKADPEVLEWIQRFNKL